MKPLLTFFGLLVISFTAAASQSSTQRLLFTVGFFQGDASPDLAQYRSFLNELNKNGLQIQSEKLYPARVLGIYQKAQGQEIDSKLVVDDLHGCSQLDAGCIRVIDGSNPSVNWRNKEFTGEVVLPTLTLRHDLIIEVGDKAEKLQAIMKQFKENIALPVGNPIN